MSKIKRKNRFARYYEEYYEDVVDYTINVCKKFTFCNTFVFLIYGICLNIINVDMRETVCGICFCMSGMSMVVFLLMKYYLTRNKKNVIFFNNTYLLIFLGLLLLVFFYHPTNIANTIVICTMITTAMTNIVFGQYVPLILSVSAFELYLLFKQRIAGGSIETAFDFFMYFSQRPQEEMIEIVGYVINDFLILVFAL